MTQSTNSFFGSQSYFHVKHPGWKTRQKKELILTQSGSSIKQRIDRRRWLYDLMRALSSWLSELKGLHQRLVCNKGELKAKARASSNKAVSRSLRKCLDLGDGRDQLCLEVSRAAEVTQSILQWCLWLVGWWGLNIWELTSAALAPLPLRALSLVNAHPLPMPLDHAHAVWFGTVQGCYCHGFSIYNMFPSLNLQPWHSLPFVCS